uniref:RING-type E3 ubiquitin transferase n=1 Tax=Plectus sambesii TaxID=2011161 RepID=A0A914WJS4_9BILA
MANVCVNFTLGYCQNGDNCRFLHPSPNDANRDVRPCQLYLQGTCRLGNMCRFSHRQAGQSERASESSQDEDDVEEIYIEDRGIQTDDLKLSNSRKTTLEKGRAIYDRIVTDPVIFEAINKNDQDLLRDLYKLFNP